MSGNQGTDAHRPIAQGRAWDVFASLKHVLACKLLNAKVGAVLLWAASVWRPSQAAVAAVCGMQAKMLASMIRLPMRPGNTCWLELHRRRLRKAWRLICLRPVLSLKVPSGPGMRRHGWLGHALQSALRWRDSEWWRHQQALPVTGERHPARFHPRRFDTDVDQFWHSVPRHARGEHAPWPNLRAIDRAGDDLCPIFLLVHSPAIPACAEYTL